MENKKHQSQTHSEVAVRSLIVTSVKRNDAHICFDRANIRYQLPEVLAAPGIKPSGLTDRLKDGTGEPELLE